MSSIIPVEGILLPPPGLGAHADLFRRDDRDVRRLVQSTRRWAQEYIGAEMQEFLFRTRPIAGGAAIAPDEGLDYSIGLLPRTDTGTFPVPTTQYLSCFTTVNGGTNSVTAVPARTTALATPGTDVVEVTGGGFARIQIPTLTTTWPVPVTNGSGRRSTMVSPGVSFAESTGAWSSNANINGFIHCNASSAGKAFYYANWADGVALNVPAAGYTLRIQAFWHLNGA